MKRYLESIKLCFAYYKQPLCLRDVSFTVSKGKKILILGVAEVGKTTLVKAISGFDNTYMGEVRFDGKNIKTIPDNEKKFSLLLAEPVFLSGSIRKNIDYLCEVESIEKLSPEQLKVVFNQFGFTKDEREKIKNLSLLEKRKLAVIRAYLKKPNAVFIDDQFEGLNKEECTSLQNAINVLCSGDVTMVFASGGESYLKNRAFFNGLGFESVLYLGLLKSYNYKDVDEFLSKKINVGVLEFCDDFTPITGVVVKQNGAYYFKQGDLMRKFDKMFYDKLSLLSLVDGEDENVTLAIKNDISTKNLSDAEFNKYLKLGDFLLFSELDGSRVI